MGKLKTQLPDRPNSVLVLGSKFTVEHPKTIAGDEPGEKVYGLTDGICRTIKIASELNSELETFERTLLHETLHAILDVSGHTYGLVDKQEEMIVTALENGLAALYRRRM